MLCCCYLGFDMRDCMTNLEINHLTKCLAQIIDQKYAENTCGNIRGYLVADEIQGFIPKQERKRFSALHTNQFTHALREILLAYTVQNRLMELFKDYPFKKFRIEIEAYPKYRYDANRFVKYRRTGEKLSFLKIVMKW